MEGLPKGDPEHDDGQATDIDPVFQQCIKAVVHKEQCDGDPQVEQSVGDVRTVAESETTQHAASPDAEGEVGDRVDEG